MKWPNSLTFIRHGESAYNLLKSNRAETDLYLKFKELFDKEYSNLEPDSWPSAELRDLANQVWKANRLGKSDYHTPLTENGVAQARATGEKLADLIDKPDVIYMSPYLRTRQTLEEITNTCPSLKGIKVVSEERVREQEHGLSTVYNDWRIFLVLQPEQAMLFKLEGDYEYRFPNGENKSDVRDRTRDFLTTLIRENAGENVLVVCHHLTLLSFRSNLERWDREKFIEVDRHERPINCGVTIYKGDSNHGKSGKLILDQYNIKLW